MNSFFQTFKDDDEGEYYIQCNDTEGKEWTISNFTQCFRYMFNCTTCKGTIEVNNINNFYWLKGSKQLYQ